MILLIALLLIPDIAHVEVVASSQPATRRIIHLLDWHFVTKDKFAADLGISDPKQIDDEHQVHVEIVEQVQEELKRVIEGLGVKNAYAEGVTEKNIEQVSARIAALRDFKPRSDSPTVLLVAEEHRHDLVRIGAAGQLAVVGKIKLFPAENHKAYKEANPVKDDKVRVDAAANARREEAVIRNVLEAEGDAVLVFGGAHDFRDEIARLAPTVEYVRIAVKSYPRNRD